MATRAIVGIKEPDSKIWYIYVHFDSYPEGLGEVLKQHYTDESKIRAMLELGDASSIAPMIKDSKFYARNMGGTLGPKKTSSDGCFHLDIERHGAEFGYIFEPDKKEWRVLPLSCMRSL